MLTQPGISDLNVQFMQKLQQEGSIRHQRACAERHFAQASASFHQEESGIQNVDASFDASNAVVVVHADWCGFCQKLKADMPQNAAALKGKKRVVMMEVDTNEFTKNYAAEHGISGYPYVLIYDGQGNVKSTIGGYVSHEAFVERAMQ